MKDIISDSFIPFLKKHLADADQTFAHKNPATLKTEFDFSLKNDELNPETLKDIISSLVQFTPNVLSPTYLNYFYSAPDPIGIIGDWLAALLNTNVHAYEASPFFSDAEPLSAITHRRNVRKYEHEDCYYWTIDSHSRLAYQIGLTD